MPKHLAARPPLDATEERQVRKLAHSVHAPADWIFHAKMIVRSWEGQRYSPDRGRAGAVIPRRCVTACMPSTNAGSMGWG